jgi:hypothetical protein
MIRVNPLAGKPQISLPRYAPVEITKGRVVMARSAVEGQGVPMVAEGRCLFATAIFPQLFDVGLEQLLRFGNTSILCQALKTGL